MADPVKIENGQSYPKEAYAYTPSDAPGSWKLRLWESPEEKATAAQVGRAVAALGAGFRGEKVEIPDADLPAVKAKVRAAWKQANPDKKPADMPDAIRAGEPTPDDVHAPKDKKPPRLNFLNRLYAALRERFSGGTLLSQDDFNAAVKHARGHAGGKARADNRQMAEDVPTGVIVALVPPPDVATRLALPGGLPPDQLHMTLFSLGDDLDPITFAEALLAIRDAAACLPPLIGTISGIGRFSAAAVGSDQDVIYASFDSPDLEDFAERIEDCLEAAGIECEDDHGFQPHITLAYVAPDAPYPDLPDPLPIRFDALHLWAGMQHIPVYLTGTAVMPGTWSESAKVTSAHFDRNGITVSRSAWPETGTIQVGGMTVSGTTTIGIPARTSDLADIAAQGHEYRLFVESAFAEAPDWIPYLPKPGTYTHPQYGEIAITRARNQRFVKNFEDRVYQDRLPVDAEHETKLSGATGWITAMRMGADGSVDAKVEWTDRGKALIAADRFRYISPEWYDSWTAPDTDKTYQDVAIGAALTTRPFFKDPALRPLIASERGLEIENAPITEGVPHMAEPTTPDQFTELQAALERRDAEILALRQASEAQSAQLTAQLTQATERIQAMETKARKERYEAMVRGDRTTPRWFGEVGQHVSLLETFADTFGEDSAQFTTYIQQQRAMAEQIAASKLFQEIGTDASGSGQSAWAKIEAEARALAESKGITIEQATEQVLKDKPRLYAEYRAEQAA